MKSSAPRASGAPTKTLGPKSLPTGSLQVEGGYLNNRKRESGQSSRNRQHDGSGLMAAPRHNGTHSPLLPDLIEAKRFLDYIGPGEEFTFQTFSDAKDSKNPDLNRVIHGTLEQHSEELTRLQQQGAGVFVMVNAGDGIAHPNRKTCRCTENVVRVRALFVDLDGAPLEPVVAAHCPDIVVESSPGRWHAYWLTNDCPLEDFKKYMTSISARFNGDPVVNDLPRVMRLPGFWHQKAVPYMTHIIHPGRSK